MKQKKERITKEQRRYLTLSQVGEITGFGKTTISRAIREKQLEAYLVRRFWRIPEDAVQRWIEGDKSKVQDDSTAQTEVVSIIPEPKKESEG